VNSNGESMEENFNLRQRVGGAVGLRGLGRGLVDSSNALLRRMTKTKSKPEVDPSLRIAHYNLVLMDGDGQVVWGMEYDAGGPFSFRPGQRLWICCEFTNRSAHEAQVAEFEIELTGEDGAVLSRFGDSFGDLLIVQPGETQKFVGQWTL